MILTGAEIIMECLKEQKVDTVFGYPGGSILNIYDALYKNKESINHILTSHEQGASHAADGYARSTGRVGVCLATSGPGATNLVTGIATAYMDSIPMVAITANVNLPLLGKDSFQEVDIAGVTMPITKHSYIVKDINVLASTIRKAFRIATSNRPGPVLVDVTKDVTAATCEFDPINDINNSNMIIESINHNKINLAAELINKSKKPYIMVGGGVVSSGASNEVRELANKLSAPVCDTLMGKGGFDGTLSVYTGMIGMHGTKASNLGVSRCDLLIVLGARFSDRVVGSPNTFAKNATIIHIDIDPAEIDKNIKTDVALIGDLKNVLKSLNPLINTLDNPEWVEEMRLLKEKHPLKYNRTTLTGPYIIETLDNIVGKDSIITTDVGQHQMWAAQYYRYTIPRTFISSGGLGTMGYGLGACIGAKMGNPDKICINIAGDGCFRMNMNELATASRYNIPIVQIVFNNGVLGMVRQWQTLFYEGRYSHTILQDKTDFVAVAKALGCEAMRVSSIDEVESAIKWAISLNAPVLLDCIIDSDDKVFPMVPAGASIADAFDGDDMKL